MKTGKTSRTNVVYAITSDCMEYLYFKDRADQFYKMAQCSGSKTGLTESITLHRNRILPDIIEIMIELDCDKKFRIIFDGEIGQDIGGLTAESVSEVDKMLKMRFRLALLI